MPKPDSLFPLGRENKVPAKNVTSGCRNGIQKPHNPVGMTLKNTDKASASPVILLLCLLIVFPLTGQGAEKPAIPDGVRVGAASAEFEADDSMIIAGGITAGKATGQEGKLRAVAVVLEKEPFGKLAIVACDVLMMTREWLGPGTAGDSENTRDAVRTILP